MIADEARAITEPFESMSELRIRHMDMIRSARGESAREEFVGRIHEFINRAKATGVRLDSPTDRDAAQNIITYWTSYLFTAGDREALSAAPPILDPFDPTNAPDLSNVACPFQGLSVFGEHDAGRFFGREEATKTLLETLRSQPLVLVVGPLGSGKTSLVIAGVIPRLRSRLTVDRKDAVILIVQPGTNPLAALLRTIHNAAPAQSLPGIETWISDQDRQLQRSPQHLRNLIEATFPGRSIIAVVDNFEQIFTLCANVKIREQFAQSLLSICPDAGTPNRVILILDEQSEQLALQLPALKSVAANPAARFRSPPPTAMEIQRIIENAAATIGLKFDEGIVEDLAKDAAGDAGTLPTLQFTLNKLWAERKGNRITWDAYQGVGKPREALRRTADAIFSNLSSYQQWIARKLFLKLVEPATAGNFVRHRIGRDVLLQIDTPDDVAEVLAAFVAAGLIRQSAGVIPGEDRFDLPHEALVNAWPLVRDWLQKEREESEKKLQLIETARLWQRSGFKSGYLLSGSALDDAALYAAAAPELKELVAASRRRQNQFLRLAFGGLLIVFLAILSMAYITIDALRQRNDQLQSSVSIQNESIEELINTVRTASLSSSLPAKERSALVDSATRSVENLANMVKGHPEYKIMLITLFNDLSDFGYDAEDWEKAERPAKTAQSLVRPLVKENPEKPALQKLLYRSTWLLADALSQGNKTEQAEAEYQDALNIANDLVRITNGDLTSNRDVAFIEPKLGDICVVKKNTECALAHYKAALAINQKLLSGLAKDDASKPEIQRDLAANMIRIGDVFSRQGVLDEALKQYQPAATIDEQLVTDYPNQLVFQSNLSRVYNQIASIRERQGDLPAVKDLYQKSLELRRTLARRDPSNNSWLDYLATQYGRIGDLSLKMGDNPGAITNYKSATNVWDILVSRMPEKSDWMRRSADVLQKLTRLLLLQPREAIIAQQDAILSNAQTALGLRSKIAQKSPDSALQHRELAVAHVSLGDVFKAINDNAEALKEYQQARSVIDNFTSAHPNEINLQSFKELRQVVCAKDSDVCS